MQHANQVYKVIKEKSNIRGYWKDEAGKLYKDNIKLIDYNRATVKELFQWGAGCIVYQFRPCCDRKP